MVLQRDAQVRVWGWAKPGAPVRVETSWSDLAMMSGTDPQGRWSVQFKTPADQPGPHQIRIQDGTTTLMLQDVLLGEVWVCGGQSNMEWTLGPGVGNGVEGGAQAAAAANDPYLRWYDVPHAVALTPLEECGGVWQQCSPQVATRMSAVGYFFGAALRRELPEVPIGLIGCNWGGTLAEAWTSEEFLARRGDFEAELARIRQARKDGADADAGAGVAALQEKWWERLEQTDEGSRAKWNRIALEDDDWKRTTLPGLFDAELNGHDGVVWYRKLVEIPQAWVQRDLVVELGPIDDCDTFWADGERWGRTHQDGSWQQPRQYRIASKLVGDTSLLLALRVVDTGGAGGLNGGADQMKIYRANHPESAISIAGEWKMRIGATLAELGEFPRQAWFHQNSPTALYNGMLAPVTRYAIRGAIFYQGESNVGRWDQYRSLFPDMVRAWRSAWGQGDFPFYWVQIAPFNYGAGERPARLREAQTMALTALPHSGMAVTMDVGAPRDIHPLQKREVGERLARWALAGPYRRAELEVSGPLLRSFETKDAELILSFDHAEGLRALDGKALAHFALAGSDRVFHAAEARVVGKTLVLRSAAVFAPVAARYCWGEADAGTLGNAAGLPAPSFRTDAWPE